MSLPEQAAKVASTTVEAMRSVPLAIALLVVNIGFLCFAGYILGEVASNAGDRNKTQMELIGKLVGDIRDCRQGPEDMTTIKGKVSWFGGPADTGVSASEDLAFWEDWDDVLADGVEALFLPQQPSGTTGLARRLDPDRFYIACRWDYDVFAKSEVPLLRVMVHAPSTGLSIAAQPADWGPHSDTGRVADLSPGLMSALGIETDDEVEITIQQREQTMPYERIVISSGHGKFVRGASGIIDEVDEARKVVDYLAEELQARGVEVVVFHDDQSKTQSENLDRIVSAHNKHERDLDVSVHFNAYEQVEKPMGVEVLYVTQSELASKVSAAIAACGFINRGGKKRTDLAFLNGTEMPSILIETCFVDSEADCELYAEEFDAICSAIADVLGGKLDEARPPEGETPPPEQTATARVDIDISGDAIVIINGQQVWP